MSCSACSPSGSISQRYLYVTSAAAVATFFFETRFRATYNALLYLDALATAVFTVLATERTLQLRFRAGHRGADGRDHRHRRRDGTICLGTADDPDATGAVDDADHHRRRVVRRRAEQREPGRPLQVSLLGIGAITLKRCCAIRWSWAFPDWLTYRPREVTAIFRSRNRPVTTLRCLISHLGTGGESC